MEKKKPSRNYFSKFEVAQGWPLEKKIGPIGPPPGKNIGAIDGEKKNEGILYWKAISFRQKQFPLDPRFPLLGCAVRRVGVGVCPHRWGKKTEGILC